MMHRSFYLYFIVISSLISSIQSEQCFAIRPYCHCEEEPFIDTIISRRSDISSSINPTSLNNNSPITNSSSLVVSILTYRVSDIYLNCSEINNSSLFIQGLISKLLPKIKQFSLSISKSDHEIVNKILNGLSSITRLMINLRGLILYDLTEIRNHTFSFDLTNLSNLNYLNITGNSVNYLDCSRFNSDLQVIDLSRNRLKNISGCSLVGDFVNLTNLDLSRNNLTFFDVIRLNELRNHLYINLTYNEWNCNQHLTPLIEQIRSVSNQSDEFSVTFADENQLKCITPKNIVNLSFRQLADIYDNIRDTKICRQCDCAMIRGNLIKLDCENRDLVVLPRKLPLNTKIVNLAHNQIASLDLKGITSIEKETWKGVIHLYVQNNSITSLNDLDFDSLKAVRLLNLTGNHLVEIPTKKWNKIAKMDVIQLGLNPWNCDCDWGIQFQQWLRSLKKDGVDLDQIKCDNRVDQPPIYKLELIESCKKTTDNYLLNYANIVLSILIVLLITKLLYDYLWKWKSIFASHPCPSSLLSLIMFWSTSLFYCSSIAVQWKQYKFSHKHTFDR